MPLLTAEQIKLLDRAACFGILSPVKHQEVLNWNSAERKHKDELAAKRVPEPVKPRYTSEVGASELGIQITLRELEIASSEREGSQKQLRIEKLKRTLANFQKRLSQLKATHGIEPLSAKPIKEERMPARPEMPTSAQAALDLLLELQTIQVNLQFVATHVVQPAVSTLGESDAELCLRWNDIVYKESPASDVTAWSKLDEIDPYRQCQILSARSAELVMQTYYCKLGFEVEDASIKQLDGASDDWKTYDLRVGARLVDVKNSRKSLHGEGNFVEHCVPKFKQLRTTGEHIVIAGVLSDYFKDPDFYQQTQQTAMVLGEVNVVEVRSLYRWARDRFGSKLDLKGIWDPGFLPGWLFEYPEAHYPRRDEAINAIEHLAWRLTGAGAFGDQLPGWLLVLCSDDGFVRSLPLEERKRKLTIDLRSMAEATGINRRSLYVYSMGIALEALSNGVSPEDDLLAFVALIAIPSKNRNGDVHPSMLGLADPLGYVGSIVKTLCDIGNKLLELGIQLIGFRLTHPAILKGVCTDGSVLTLIAYCGGWQTLPVKARCGTSPLTIANDTHCPSCGHLVCHNCGHCSNLCKACKPRQLEFTSLIQSAQSSSGENSTDPDDDGESYQANYY